MVSFSLVNSTGFSSSASFGAVLREIFFSSSAIEADISCTGTFNAADLTDCFGAADRPRTLNNLYCGCELFSMSINAPSSDNN